MAVWVEKAVAQDARKTAAHSQGSSANRGNAQEARNDAHHSEGTSARRGRRRKKLSLPAACNPENDKVWRATKELHADDTMPAKRQQDIIVQPAAVVCSKDHAISCNVEPAADHAEELQISAVVSSEATCEDSHCSGSVGVDRQLLHCDTKLLPQDSNAALAGISEAHASSLSCPSGHALVVFTASVPTICSLCTDEPEVGAKMWGCRACDFDICSHCRRQFTAAGHDGNSTDSTDTPRNVGEVSWTRVDDVWWPQDVDWSWDWNDLETDHEYELLADETLLGPDGDIYDVFYPGDSPPWEELSSSLDASVIGRISPRSGSSDVPAACSHGAACSHDAEFGQQVAPAEHLQSCGKHASRPQTSAEIGILSILTFMRGVASERHPARVHLFETVQTAAVIGLGDHFDRFALVGSTALRIDTPDSDLDAVVFTRSSFLPSGEDVKAPMAATTLSEIARTLHTCDPSLRLQLVDCTRVPVLTVFSADGFLSLDLTVDQPLSEWHVLWLQSQRTEPVFDAPFMQGVPVPTLDGWEQGLEAAALRCIKWWLRRRHIPVSKEGGYPTVVWTLMVIHALRCSVFYNEADGDDVCTLVDERTLLGAIAVFFDRFSEGGLAGTLLFAKGKHAQLIPHCPPDSTKRPSALSSEAFSVLDPTTTSEDSAAFGIAPVDLAPKISSATQLLQAYELQRAQQLSSLALTGDESSLNGGEGGVALCALFAEVDERTNFLPAMVPQEPTGVIFLHDGAIMFGILQQVNLKHGWAAAFLHRHDKQSSVGVEPCHIDLERRVAVPHAHCELQWLPPADVVCMAPLLVHNEAYSHGHLHASVLELDAESFERWCKMHTLLGIEFVYTQPAHSVPRSKNHKNSNARKKRQGKVVRI